MYVKVHKKGNQWFRTDNGALVGTELDTRSRRYKYLAAQVGKQVIVKVSPCEDKMIYRGYFFNNKFIHLKPDEKCSDKTYGYYTFVLG